MYFEIIRLVLEIIEINIAQLSLSSSVSEEMSAF